ncbi:hypothetical protein RMCBS344292_02225 [Rhizopus microsporus]|nr:hypothetical protein RMCBS344292_02225 [Rhizopus microsporus]
MSDWDALRNFLPTSFGKQEEKKDFTQEFEKTKREAAAAKSKKDQSNGKKDGQKDSKPLEKQSDDEDEEEDEVEDAGYSFSESPPISHEIKLNDHFRAVSALTLDPAGARLITGGYDYDVKFWDFAGMDRSFKPFRTIQPCEDHQIHELQYSLSGDSFLVIAGNNRAKIFNRDGFELSEYAKGDPYIRDLRHTDGHVDGKETEVNGKVGTRTEYYLSYLFNAMDIMDKKGIKDHYIVLDNALISPRWLEE